MVNMPMPIEMTEEFQNHKYLVRSFVPRRIADIIQRLTEDKKEKEIIFTFLREMVLEPKIDEKFWNSDDCNGEEMEALFYYITDRTRFMNFTEILALDTKDPNYDVKVKEIQLERVNELKKKVRKPSG